MKQAELAVIPRPKKWTPTGGNFILRNGLRLLSDGAPESRAQAERLRQRLRAITGFDPRWRSGGVRTEPSIYLRRVARLPEPAARAEGYHIAINERRVVLEACSAQGLRYAVETFADLLEQRDGGWRAPAGELWDWPDFAWRGFMIDPARCFVPPEQMRKYLDWMGRAKLNVLHVHFTDCEAFTIESRRFPELNKRCYHHMLFGSPKGMGTLDDFRRSEEKYGGVYRAADIKALAAHARERGIELVPEISMPSHATPILRAFPELKCRVAKGRPSETVLCIGSEKTYALLEKLFDEILPLFSSPFVHIGSDEIDCRDVLFQNRPFFAQSWNHCEVCRAEMRRQGMTSVFQLFYVFLERVRKMLSRRGKRLIMWNDYVDLARPVSLSREIVMQFWRIAYPQRGPRRGCSFNKLLKAGFPVINSFYPDTYFDVDMRDRRLARWNPEKTPTSARAVKKHIVGAEMCAWNYRPHYAWGLPSAIPFFADRVWNRAPVPDLRIFARHLARHLFGPGMHPDTERVFEYLGSVLPPSAKGVRAFPPDERAFPPELGWAKADFQRMERLLRRESQNPRAWNPDVLEEYAESIRWIRRRP